MLSKFVEIGTMCQARVCMVAVGWGRPWRVCQTSMILDSRRCKLTLNDSISTGKWFKSQTSSSSYTLRTRDLRKLSNIDSSISPKCQQFFSLPWILFITLKGKYSGTADDLRTFFVWLCCSNRSKHCTSKMTCFSQNHLYFGCRTRTYSTFFEAGYFDPASRTTILRRLLSHSCIFVCATIQAFDWDKLADLKKFEGINFDHRLAPVCLPLNHAS